jgi:hypothetical protein
MNVIRRGLFALLAVGVLIGDAKPGSAQVPKQRGMFSVPVPLSPLLLATAPAVQRELGLSAEQCERAVRIYEAYRVEEGAVLYAARQAEAIRGELPSDEDRSDLLRARNSERIRQELLKNLEAVDSRFSQQLVAALSAAQWRRLMEIVWQDGISVLFQPEIQNSLGITEEQQQALAPSARAQVKFREELSGAFHRSLNPGGSREQFQRELERTIQLERELDGIARKFLTADQQQQLFELRGKQFELLASGAWTEAQQTLRRRWQGFRFFPEPVQIFDRLRASQVQAALRLTKEQTERLRKFQHAVQAEPALDLNEAFLNRSADEVTQRFPKYLQDRHALDDRLVPDLAKILKPEQFQLLRRVWFQVGGMPVLRNPEVVAALRLSEEQQKKLAPLIQEYYWQRLQFPRLGPPGNGLDDRKWIAARNEQIRQLDKEHNAAALEILTWEQKQALRTLCGDSVSGIINNWPLGPKWTPPLPWELPGSVTLWRDQLFLLSLTPVRKELALTPAQASQVASILDAYRQFETDEAEAQRIVVEALLPAQRAERASRGKEILLENIKKRQTRQAETLKRIAEVLQPGQLQRLTEIWLQDGGTTAFFHPEVIAALRLSEEQQARLHPLANEINGARIRLQVELQKTGDVAAAAEKLRDLDRDRITQALSRLTDEQQRKFQQMCGQPFNTAPLWSATEKQD